MLLQLFTEPSGCRSGVTLGEMHIQIRHIPAQRLVQAAGIDIAQRIGREIAEQPY